MLPPSPIPTVINHLLAQEPWARDKLGVHKGKIACFDGGLVAIKLEVMADGLVKSAAGEAEPNVTIHAKISELPLIAQNRERAFSYVKVDGDADFANTISQLSQSLRWDVEEDLSKWIGDIAAVRVVAGARSAFDTIQSTQRKFAENIAEYFLEENPILMRPRDVANFTRDVARLRDDIERLGKRIEKLNGSAR